MTELKMHVTLSAERTRQIKDLARTHGYEPEELIQLSFGLIPMLLHERALGHKFCVTEHDGKVLKEWLLMDPKAKIDEDARRIIESAFSPPQNTEKIPRDNAHQSKLKSRRDQGDSSSELPPR